MINAVALTNSNELSVAQLVTTAHGTCYARFGDVGCWGCGACQLGRGVSVSNINLASNAIAIDFGTAFVVKDLYGGAFHLCAVSEEKCAKCWV